MAATIKYQGDIAVIRDGEWSSENETLERLLRTMTETRQFEAHGSDPNPDTDVAEHVVAELGGDAELISYDDVSP